MKRNTNQVGFAFGDFELFGAETAAMATSTPKPAPGQRWRDKERPAEWVGTIQEPDATSPQLIPILFDGLTTTALFEPAHFLDWLEPVPIS